MFVARRPGAQAKVRQTFSKTPSPFAEQVSTHKPPTDVSGWESRWRLRTRIVRASQPLGVLARHHEVRITACGRLKSTRAVEATCLETFPLVQEPRHIGDMFQPWRDEYSRCCAYGLETRTSRVLRAIGGWEDFGLVRRSVASFVMIFAYSANAAGTEDLRGDNSRFYARAGSKSKHSKYAKTLYPESMQHYTNVGDNTA